MILSKSVRSLSLSLAAAGCVLSHSFAQDDPSKPTKDNPPTNVAALDGVKGYGGLAFGSDFSAAKDLEIEQDRGPLKIYKKKGEKPLLGPALLETVLYYFYEGKLYGVAFHTNDGQDSLNLKSVFGFAFGEGQESADEGPSTIWMGKKNGALFDLNTSTGDASAFLFDIKAHDAFLKYESEAAQKAASQLVKGE
jgi:hypothetical protein